MQHWERCVDSHALFVAFEQLGGETLSEAAAVARISATAAYQACAIGSTQVHGALGVTWESNCHLAYRRAQALAGHPGSLRSWKERLVALLARRANTRDLQAPHDAPAQSLMAASAQPVATP